MFNFISQEYCLKKSPKNCCEKINILYDISNNKGTKFSIGLNNIIINDIAFFIKIELLLCRIINI